MTEAIEQQLSALRDRIDLIWANHEREHKQHEAAHAREHEFAQKAIDTAAILSKENKADANEWRGTMDDRERNFATKADIASLSEKIGNLERIETRRAETERLRQVDEAEDKRQTERRVNRSQWTIALIVGTLASVGAVLVNILLRMA